jgi:biotin--protein ligase
LKWPNDIYADLPGQGLKKVGGLLVNSSFLADEFLLVIGKAGISENQIAHSPSVVKAAGSISPIANPRCPSTM